METSTVVALPVREGFAIPDERLYRDPVFVEDVLTTGVRLIKEREAIDAKVVMEGRYKATLEKYEQERESLQNTIDIKAAEIKRLQNDLKDVGITTYDHGRAVGKKEGEDLLTREKEALEEKKGQLASLTQELAKLRTKHTEEVERLQFEKEKEIERIRQESQGILKSLEIKLDSVHSIFQGKDCTSTRIGKIGETFACQILEKNFNPCNVTVTADDDHSADLLLEESGVHIRIEVKNKQKLDRKNDLQKFHDDLKNHSEQGHQYMAGLFVQLQDTTLIDGHRIVHYETRHGMPVIYCGDVLQSRTLFIASVRLLVKLALSGKFSIEDTSSSEDDLEGRYQAAITEHRKTALELLRTIYEQDKDIRSDMKLCDERITVLKEREARLSSLKQRQEEVLKLFPNIKEELKTTMAASVGEKKIDSEKKKAKKTDQDIILEKHLVDFIREKYRRDDEEPSKAQFIRDYEDYTRKQGHEVTLKPYFIDTKCNGIHCLFEKAMRIT